MTVNTQLLVDKEEITQYSLSAGEPEWMLTYRLRALEQASQLDLPAVEKTKIDKWNFTSFRPFVKANPVDKVSDLPASLQELIGEDQDHVLVQQNGSVIYQKLAADLAGKGVIFTDLATALKDHGALIEKYFMKSIPFDENRLTALHQALWSGGVFIYIPKNTEVEVPLLALFSQEGEGNGLVPHVLIVVEENSKLTYVENRISQAGDNVHNGLTEIFVGSGSHVLYASVNRFAAGTVDYSKRVAVVKRDARIDWAIGEMGDGNTVSYNLSILEEQGSQADMKMVSVGTNEQRGNFTSKVVHIGENSESNILSKGVLLDTAAQVFNGITKMEKGARRANGEQTERLLMLSRTARGDANPILLIDENDVKCGHAASVGRIDPIQLYYLMSRGITREDAERLIIRGFLDPVVSEIPTEPVQSRLTEAIERKLSR